MKLGLSVTREHTLQKNLIQKAALGQGDSAISYTGLQLHKWPQIIPSDHTAGIAYKQLLNK